MRVLIQRVKKASVTIGNKLHSEIGEGMLVFLGIEDADDDNDIRWLAAKIVNLRIFDDDNGVMNHSALDKGKDIMIVSQFTLHASTKKGNRPSYIRAARPEKAVPLYEAFIRETGDLSGKTIKTGVFGAMMDVELLNDGPVTIFIDSKARE